MLVCVSAGVFSLSGVSSATSYCQQSQAVNIQQTENLSCNTKHQKRVSWTNWLLNKSKSSQFHFLDLLELLSRKAD